MFDIFAMAVTNATSTLPTTTTAAVTFGGSALAGYVIGFTLKKS